MRVRTFTIPNLDGHMPVLDGVRGFAMVGVFVYHNFLFLNPTSNFHLIVKRLTELGWISVDLFFVLSGFLITGILLRTRGQERYYYNFIVRRMLRLSPLYYTTLFFLFLGLPILFGPALPPEYNSLSGQELWYIFYLHNWIFVELGGTPAFKYVDHLWSLAIEEQFYLLWPVIVYFLSGQPLKRFCYAGILVAIGTRTFYWAIDASPFSAHFSTFARIDSLLLGALLAIFMRDKDWCERCSAIAQRWTGWLALIVFLLIAIRGNPLIESVRMIVGYTLLDLLCAVFIFRGLTETQSRLNSFLSHSALRIVGKYSYAVYIFHWPVLLLMYSYFPTSLLGTGMLLACYSLVVCFLATMALALLSWLLLEKHFLDLKRHFE